MDSFGIWYKPNENRSTTDEHEKGCPPIDLHVNLWDINAKDTRPFIDMGILLSDFRAYDSVYLYIPFTLGGSDLDDLSDLLADKVVADLVFNDRCAITAESDGFTTLQRKNDDKMILYSFGPQTGNELKIKLGKDSNGKTWSIVIFSIASFVKKAPCDWKRLYIRFRVKTYLIENELFCDIKRKNQFLESGFEATRIADIKFNMKRNIARNAIDWVEDANGLPMDMAQIHFLLIEPANNAVESYGAELGECRKLEDEWGKYLRIKKEERVGDLLAYHWKRQKKRDGEPLDDYALMARITRPETNWKVIAVYILVGIVLNIVASFIYGLFTPSGQ